MEVREYDAETGAVTILYVAVGRKVEILNNIYVPTASEH
jgi:hypothetical protein